MHRLLGVAISIGVADSLNPTTIAPALYLASGEHPRRRVTGFTVGVFLVYLLGGAAIAFGPGELLFDLIPRPEHRAKHVVEIVVGVVVLVIAAFVWSRRDRLGGEEKRLSTRMSSRHSALLGAGITAIELPTAFPYFAAIAAIVSSGVGPERQLLLLVLFNVCFILPLLGILTTLWLVPCHATQLLDVGRRFLQRRWPELLASVGLLAGAFVILMGVSGLLVVGRGKLHIVARSFRHLFHLGTKP